MNDSTFQRYKIIVAYDGTDFNGWQSQKTDAAICDVLEKSFVKVFKKSPRVVASSRTDAGVHAVGQVAKIDLDFIMDPAPFNSVEEKIYKIWNAHLPGSILIRSVQPVSRDFHPQKNVLQKTYYYHFFNKKPLPMVSRYGLYFRFPFDLQKMLTSLNVFVGEHDFRSFCTGTDLENTIKKIDSINLRYYRKFDLYQIEVKGKSFLRYMIRRMVGAALEVARNPELDTEYLRSVLHGKNPHHHLPNAPAHGLMLRSIKYKQENLC